MSHSVSRGNPSSNAARGAASSSNTIQSLHANRCVHTILVGIAAATVARQRRQLFALVTTAAALHTWLLMMLMVSSRRRHAATQCVVATNHRSSVAGDASPEFRLSHKSSRYATTTGCLMLTTVVAVSTTLTQLVGHWIWRRRPSGATTTTQLCAHLNHLPSIVSVHWLLRWRKLLRRRQRCDKDCAHFTKPTTTTTITTRKAWRCQSTVG